MASPKQIYFGGLVAFVLVVCFAGWLVSSGHSPMRTGAALEVTPESLKLQTREAATKRFTFLLKNVGDSSLEITDIVPLCQCAILSETNATIPPGETWELKLDVRPPGAGQRTSGVDIYSNCVKKPVKRVSITIDREIDPPFVMVWPGVVNIVATSNASEVTLIHFKTIENQSATRWVTRSEVVDLPFAEVQEMSFSEDPYSGGQHAQRIYDYKLRIKDAIPEGVHSGFVQFLSDDEDGKATTVLNVAVRVRHDPPVRFAPETLYFRRLSENHFSPINVIVQARSARLVIERVHGSASWLKATVDEPDNRTPNASLRLINVRIDDEQYDGADRAELHVHTTEPENRDWIIPVVVAKS